MSLTCLSINFRQTAIPLFNIYIYFLILLIKLLTGHFASLSYPNIYIKMNFGLAEYEAKDCPVCGIPVPLADRLTIDRETSELESV
jgi:hypothetical protein